MTSENTRKLLYRAAEIIEARRWCRGTVDGPDGTTCITGAISRAGDPLCFPAAANTVSAYLGRNLMTHNDTTLTSTQEAAALLRAAADHQEVAA